MIYIRPDLSDVFAQERTVPDFMRVQGEVYKQVVTTRRTLRFDRGGRAFFIKIHSGVGWKEIIKNLSMARLPVLGAANEWRAIQKLERIGLNTMRVAAYGQEGTNPATIKSFIVTDAITNTQSLEEWLPCLEAAGVYSERTRVKRSVIKKVGEICRKLHAHGVNHRDFYLCHLRIDLSEGGPYPVNEDLRIYVMDLHRTQIRRKTPKRWRVKDVAGLFYSCLFSCNGLSLSRRDYLRFVEAYSGMSWRDSLESQRAFWNAVARKLRAMSRKGSEPVPPLARLLLNGQSQVQSHVQ